jgi:hypothetical protein
MGCLYCNAAEILPESPGFSQNARQKSILPKENKLIHFKKNWIYQKENPCQAYSSIFPWMETLLRRAGFGCPMTAAMLWIFFLIRRKEPLSGLCQPPFGKSHDEPHPHSSHP